MLPSAAQILAALRGVRWPAGAKARIARILKAGGYGFTYAAPSGGSLVFGWYYRPAKARQAKSHKRPGRTLVATVTATIGAPGTSAVTIKLTRAGRKLFAKSRHLKLTVDGAFTPAGAATATSITSSFALRR